jgi:hypothetical protein
MGNSNSKGLGQRSGQLVGQKKNSHNKMKSSLNDNVGVPLGQQEYLNGIMSPTMLQGNFLSQSHAARKSHGYV